MSETATQNASRVTGQIMFRKAADYSNGHAQAPDGSGRRVMMVVGVIAVPDDFPFDDETLYTISDDQPDIVVTALFGAKAVKGRFVVHPESGQTLPEEMRKGFSIDGLLTAGIWRC